MRILYWSPRALGLIYVGFLSLFALDVFASGQGLGPTLVALAMHLIPSAILLIAVLVAWRRELLGAALLAGAGGSYSLMARDHPTWVIVIAGPVFLLAALFMVSRWTTPRSQSRETRA